jgi:hypothetical protein
MKKTTVQPFTLPKTITIINEVFTLEQDTTKDGGAFDFATNVITIGTKAMATQPAYVFEVLLHEISEAVHCKLEQRYTAQGGDQDYLFAMTHKQFQIHTSIVAGILWHQILSNQ